MRLRARLDTGSYLPIGAFQRGAVQAANPCFSTSTNEAAVL